VITGYGNHHKKKHETAEKNKGCHWRSSGGGKSIRQNREEDIWVRPLFDPSTAIFVRKRKMQNKARQQAGFLLLFTLPVVATVHPIGLRWAETTNPANRKAAGKIFVIPARTLHQQTILPIEVNFLGYFGQRRVQVRWYR
jgi:hypothetical protein